MFTVTTAQLPSFLGYNHWNMIFNVHHFPSLSFPILYLLLYSKHFLVPSWPHFEFNLLTAAAYYEGVLDVAGASGGSGLY